MNKVFNRIGILTFSFALVMGTLHSCKQTKSVNNNSNVGTENNDRGSEDTYVLIVSFYSPGDGIDHQAKNDYLAFLSNHYPNLDYEKRKWGREGEIDFCFQLNKLSKDQKLQFVNESKDLLSKSEKVHIYENKPCIH